jgi:hypothetical protein
MGGGRAAAQGQLDVRSEPPGAAISLDGTAQGVTPRLVAAPAGKHTIVLTLAGYLDERSEITVEHGRTKVYLRLARAGAGRVRVRDEAAPAPATGMGLVRVITEPPGLTVLMNGEKVEAPTPVAFEVAPGTYTLVIRWRDAELLSSRTAVEAGWKVQVRRDLTKQVRAAERAAPPLPKALRAGTSGTKPGAAAAPTGPAGAADPTADAGPPARTRTAAECGCMPPKRLKICVEKRRECRYHPAGRDGRGPGYAACTRCARYRRLGRAKLADAKRGCDTRENRAIDCPCADIGRVLEHCLEPAAACLRRCGSGDRTGG